MVVVFFLFTTTLFSLYLVLMLTEPKTKMNKRIKTFINIEKQEIRDDEEINEAKTRTILSRFRDITKGYFEKKMTSSKELNLEKKLLQSGKPLGLTVIDFQVLKIVLNIIFPVVSGAYGMLIGFGFLGVFCSAILGVFISIFLPEFYINQKIKGRYQQAIKELPDFLDSITVCLEAGLGFDGALNKVIAKKTGVLSSEFHICLEEIRLGKTRKEALGGIKDRLDFDEIKSLINSILQAEKLGISVVHILRVKSVEEREKRRQRAEESAMKAPVKMLFPLILFIFPSIFIVLLGPVVIQFMNEFGK
jgi:tight adherence protein C